MKCFSLCFLVLSVWMVSDVTAQRGVCYVHSSYARTAVATGSRNVGEYYNCGWFGWNWARCHRSRTVYFTYQVYQTAYSQRRVCCAGYSENFGNCIPRCPPGCQNGGTCVRLNECSCATGYMGNLCQQAICQPGCQNGGTCVRPNECSCANGYVGTLCQHGPFSITPNYGHMFGGTPVIATGPSFSTSDTISCHYGDIKVEHIYISNEQILCVSPSFNKIGEIILVVYVTANNGVTTTFGSTFSSISPDRAHVVDISSPSLMLQPIGAATIKWNPEDIVPNHLPDTNTALNVDITLYMQQYSQDERSWNVDWEIATSLAISVPINDGENEVFIPPLALSCRLPLHDNTRSVQVGLCPVAVKVSVSQNDETNEGITLPDSVGAWSGIVFMESIFPKPNLRDVCDRWGEYEMKSGISGKGLLEQVIPCPPNEATARRDPAFEEETTTSLFRATSYSQKAMIFFHSGISACYRQFTPNSDGFGQQCCYGPDRRLLIGEPSGGSVDMMSPKIDYNRHIADDIVPYIFCCKGGIGLTNCGEYYKWRPSGDQIRYRLPIPACIFGDPHIITLDGLKYTFNGKGEFTMVKTDDESFTLQGRMDTILDVDRNPTLGTVFTALAAREERTNTTVQFNILGDGIQVYVNHEIAILAGISELIKENVTMRDNGNNSVSAFFKDGAKMEIKAENGIISVMLITLPDFLKGRTQGLMGNFNGDSSDDLIPKSASKAISANSSLEDIHNIFGLSWILESASESLFVYNPGESFSSYYSPIFQPVFEPVFKSLAIEDKAREVCGDDKNCLFDVAATSRVDIGVATLQGSESFNEIVEMAVPILCDPPCVNGACVQNNTCGCSEGFEGDLCEISVMSPCENNICQNNGTCVKHVLTYICECPDGYVGAFCQEEEPPFHIRLLNGSPRVSNGTLYIDFEPSAPLSSAECHLKIPGSRKINCISGHMQYSNLSAGSYVLLIQATSINQEKTSVRRIVHIGENGDEEFCAVHLINEGVVISGKSASLFFQGTEAVDSYLCKLRGPEFLEDFTSCHSPTRYQYLGVGEYRFQVVPVGCGKGKRLSIKFNII